jgi:hypothetical protein
VLWPRTEVLAALNPLPPPQPAASTPSDRTAAKPYKDVRDADMIMAPTSELRLLSLFSGTFMTVRELFQQQPRYARHNRNIRQVEDVPME